MSSIAETGNSEIVWTAAMNAIPRDPDATFPTPKIIELRSSLLEHVAIGCSGNTSVGI